MKKPVFRFTLQSGWSIATIGSIALAMLILPAVAMTPVASVSGSVDQPHLDGTQLVIPAATARSMQLSTETVHTAQQPGTLTLTGQLMLDPAKLVHVTTRFGGEVVQVATVDGADGPTIRIGQKVKKGQLLARIWSKEIGEKKSDLVDALSQLYLDEATYRNLKSLEKSGAIQQRSIDEMQRNYESDLIQVERIRRTLTSWRISESEMLKIEAEARRIHARATAGPSIDPDAQTDPKPEDVSAVDGTWGEIQIVAPVDGTILEKNLTVGDIVGTADDLFKIVDLSQLIVMGNIYEEDLAKVISLPADKRVWRIEVNSETSAGTIDGTIDVVGDVIDPNQHTAVLQGPIDNSRGELRIGQFVQTVLDVPVQPGLLEVPLGAVIDAGPKNSVFVSRSGDLTHWQRIEVTLVRRTSQFAWIAPDQKMTLHAGDKVLIRGCLELSSVLEELEPQKTPP